jgi:uncharacterized protein YggT (Ycf19 family)
MGFIDNLILRVFVQYTSIDFSRIVLLLILQSIYHQDLVQHLVLGMVFYLYETIPQILRSE